MTTRTDVPLVPVPFGDRVASPLWDSLTPKMRCQWCDQCKPYGAFPVPMDWKRNHLPTCNACLNRRLHREGVPA